MTLIPASASRRSLSARVLIISTALALALVASEARAATINLVALNGSGATAKVSNYSLVGNVFSFDLTNTSSVGFFTSLGVALGDIVDITGFTTNAPFTYTIIHDGAPPPDGASLPANDFFLAPSSQATGINPGQTFSYSFTGLTMDDGSPLSGITADLLASGLSVRVRGLPTPSGADLLAAVPEPTSLLLLVGGLSAGAVRRRLRKHI